MLVNNSVNDVIDDVTMSKIMSIFWRAVTSLLSNLKRWSKDQNVENTLGHQDTSVAPFTNMV